MKSAAYKYGFDLASTFTTLSDLPGTFASTYHTPQEIQHEMAVHPALFGTQPNLRAWQMMTGGAPSTPSGGGSAATFGPSVGTMAHHHRRHHHHE